MSNISLSVFFLLLGFKFLIILMGYAATRQDDGYLPEYRKPFKWRVGVPSLLFAVLSFSFAVEFRYRHSLMHPERYDYQRQVNE